jgi:hypothetical protein
LIGVNNQVANEEQCILSFEILVALLGSVILGWFGHEGWPASSRCRASIGGKEFGVAKDPCEDLIEVMLSELSWGYSASKNPSHVLDFWLSSLITKEIKL